ncbi:MAG: hypothetical protein H6718_11490 [Polyangiaceae bacterium]|nr:hypothetical protein [Polyangiaceae bacterium]
MFPPGTRGRGEATLHETGLSCTRYRYFDNSLGRWLSPDPLGTAGGYNLLGFNGSPTLVSDPLGLKAEGKKAHSGDPSVESPGARSGSHTKRAREDFPDLHPQKKKDDSAPKTGDNKLNSDHLTPEQKKRLLCRIRADSSSFRAAPDTVLAA